MHKKSNQNIFLYRSKINFRGINKDELEQHMNNNKVQMIVLNNVI